ncbi:hypothetical protein, partial [Xanthomonas arboricola]|uniref:hypothetical protein n=1 Tax=Xanthomonas arboricola TaxID=56448 RepID=UPI0006A543B0
MKNNEFNAVHFDVGSSRVHRNGVDLAEILGFDLDDTALIQLAGAPTGSHVTLVEKVEWPEVDDGENVPSGVLLQVKNDRYFSRDLEVVIFLDGRVGVASLYIKLVMFLDLPERKGIAGHMIGVIRPGFR